MSCPEKLSIFQGTNVNLSEHIWYYKAGADPGFGFGAKLSTLIEAVQALRVYGGVIWRGGFPLGRGLRRGQSPSTEFCSPFLGLEMRILVHYPVKLSICFCTAIRPGPDLQYICPVCQSLTFQAHCGSIKSAGVPAEEDTEHYLPWW